MKLRLVSRLMVLTLIVVVGVIIIIHEHTAASSAPHAARPTPSGSYSLPAASAETLVRVTIDQGSGTPGCLVGYRHILWC